MRINQNISAMNTYSRLTAANNAKSSSLAKLSSGLRINKAGDDAAGLAISEKMRGQISGLKQAIRNSQDGISLIQTAEGALSETHAILNRMRELTVQSNNSTNTEQDKQAIKDEMEELRGEIDGIATRTQFNGQDLLKGTLGLKLLQTIGESPVNDPESTALAHLGIGYKVDVTNAKAEATYTFGIAKDGDDKMVGLTLTDGSGVTQSIEANEDMENGTVLNFSTFGIKITLGTTQEIGDLEAKVLKTAAGGKASLQIGANKNQTLNLSINDMSAKGLGVDAIDVIGGDFNSNLDAIDDAIKSVSEERSKLGAYQNRLDHTINNLTTTAENLSAAESRIRDVDMAEEMMEFTKNNILSQAAISMLAQANQMPQAVLHLLQ